MPKSTEKRLKPTPRSRKPESIRSMLATGTHRLDIGRVREVAALIRSHPRKARAVVECLFDPDPGTANRAADALERASYHHPSLLAPWKDVLLGLLPDAEHNKLRWNLALMTARMELTPPECRRLVAILNSWLDDKSSIVKTAAMHGLAGVARQDASLLPEVLDILRILSRSGTPAMRARGRILLKKLEASPDRTQRNRPQRDDLRA